MSKTAVEILREARELVARPGGWTQGKMARDAHGQGVFHRDKEASCFCAMGALMLASNSWCIPNVEAHRALISVMPREFDGSISDFNDAPGRTQEQVVALFDAAIARLEAAR